MALYENEICLVCNKPFKKDDDIVVCPVCATPHHRACYNELGHCVNSKKHKEGYDYTAAQAGAGTLNDSVLVSEPEVDNHKEKSNANRICKNCGSELSGATPFCYRCGAKQEEYAFSEESSFAISQFDDDEKIECRKVNDIITTVNTNTTRFVRKFKKNKKMSWNWCAFFFGPMYLFYRKMYKEGIFAMLISYIASLYVNGYYSDEIGALNKYAQDNMTAFVDGTASAEMVSTIKQLYMAVYPATLIIAGVTIAICIVVALFADWFYKKKVFSIIDSVDKTINADDKMSHMMFFQGEGEMTKAQIRQMYLSKSGGTNMFLPLMLIAISFIF